MPKFLTGDMFLHRPTPGVYVVTTNRRVNALGCLVMGRGAALRATGAFPGIALQAGTLIRQQFPHRDYGYVELAPETPGIPNRVVNPDAHVGLLQVKVSWDQPADLLLIEYSLSLLASRARHFPHTAFYLNFPGIGNGGLRRDQVEPMLWVLPDNVTVFELPVLQRKGKIR